MRPFIISILIIVSAPTRSQDDPRLVYARQIDSLDLASYVHDLSSDDMQGRKTGSVGLEKAATYIEKQFKSIGLMSILNEGTSYRQEFKLIRSTPDINQVEINDYKLKNGVDYFFEGEMHMEKPQESRLIFLSGSQLNNLDHLDIKDKVVAFPRLEDPFENFECFHGLARLKPRLIIQMIQEQSLEKFLEAYPSSGERGTYLASDPNTQHGIGNLYMDIRVVQMVTGYSQEQIIRDPQETNIRYHIQRKLRPVTTSNLVGVLKGEDSSNFNLIISAHYDHIGIKNRLVYSGADDNASGMAALLEIAEAFKQANDNGVQFDGNIFFVAFSAEEDGLWGSRFFVENPPVPLGHISANFNLDMVGRISPEYDDYGNYLYLLGADGQSKALHETISKVNDQFANITLDYSFDNKDHPLQVLQRGDHWNFAKAGIPIIFFFGGIHDDYHLPTDTADKIDYSALKTRTELIYHTAWELIKH